MSSRKFELVSVIVFVVSVVIIFINLIPVVFPRLLVNLIYPTDVQLNSFEVGYWAVPVIFTNISFLYFGIFIYKFRPKIFSKIFSFIRDFEISKKVTLITIISILVIYNALTYDELFIDEIDEWMDFERIKQALQGFPFGEEGAASVRNLFVKNFFLSSSIYLFDNIKIIPFIASNALLILTYLFTSKIASKRLAGVIALIFLIQSFTFRIYDTVATYSNFWTLFYLLSLYLIYKVWYTSPILFILSIFSKPLTFVFVPLSLFFVLMSNLVRKRKIILIIAYIAITALMIFALSITESGLMIVKIEFVPEEFLIGFTTWPYHLRYEGLLVSLILPLIFGLFITARKFNKNATSVLFLIVGTALSIPLLYGLTGYDIHPYRHMPFVVFFSIGIGMIFSKFEEQKLSKKDSQ